MQNKNPYQVKYTEYISYSDKIDIEKKILQESVYMHWHEFCELELVMDGEGIQRKNRTLPFSRGVLSLQMPMDFHEVIINSANPPSLYSVKFAETFISPEIFQALMQGRRNEQIILSGAEYENLKMEFDQLYKEFTGKERFREILLKDMIEKILILFIREIEKPDEEKEEILHKTDTKFVPSYDVLGACLNYIQNHYAENITLAEMAKQANMSQTYFSSFFKQNTGCTFRDYLKNVRLRYALSLLANSELPVYKVSEMTGFVSYEHFSRLFTKEVGIAPSSFRKQVNERKN